MGQISSSRRDSRTLECILSGAITATQIATMRRDVEALMAASPTPGSCTFLVLQTEEMTGFSVDVRAPITALLRAVHAAGIELLIGVAPSVFARMTGYAIAMEAGIPLRVVRGSKDVGLVLSEELRKRVLRAARPPVRPAARV